MHGVVKVLLSIIGGAIFLVVLAVGGIFYFTSGMVGVADQFLAAAGKGQMDLAYEDVSADFRSGTSKAELRDYFERIGLDEYQEASWSSRSINGARGDLTGSVTTTDGGVIPLTLRFVKGADGWKIYAIEKPQSGLQAESDRQAPGTQRQVALVRETVSVFAESVNAKDMQAFHGYISGLWKRQFSVDDLNDAYGKFFGAGLDLTVLDQYKPVIDETSGPNENGVFTVEAHYPTQPNTFHVDASYVYEGVGWQLMGLSVEIQ